METAQIQFSRTLLTYNKYVVIVFLKFEVLLNCYDFNAALTGLECVLA